MQAGVFHKTLSFSTQSSKVPHAEEQIILTSFLFTKLIPFHVGSTFEGCLEMSVKRNCAFSV